MKNIFENKIILVTGGCGSIGSEIVNQLLKFNPKVIRIFDNNERASFEFSQKIGHLSNIRFLLGDVRDRERLMRAMEDVDIVFHAAALKHVPLCEYNPFEAVNTNVLGTKNVVDVAIQHKIERFIGISTDKAVNPVNTMGATKLLSERIITHAPIGSSGVKFCCVRFGNVLASSGSVIRIFQEQIAKGGPITITDVDMDRFFMSIDEAVKLVLKAATLTKNGETFILKMDSLRIIDLAEVLIEELALKHGHKKENIDIKIVGIRPGEKKSETLITVEESAYVNENDDLYYLNSALMSSTVNSLNKTSSDLSEYSSNTTKLLSKDEIKKKLKEINII